MENLEASVRLNSKCFGSWSKSNTGTAGVNIGTSGKFSICQTSSLFRSSLNAMSEVLTLTSTVIKPEPIL